MPTGVGWYRKEFNVPEGLEGKSIFIDFDGVFKTVKFGLMVSIWEKRANGYISFRYELTPYLKFGQEKNVIAVRVDNSKQPNSAGTLVPGSTEMFGLSPPMPCMLPNGERI